jgi:hypothetical protein
MNQFQIIKDNNFNTLNVIDTLKIPCFNNLPSKEPGMRGNIIFNKSTKQFCFNTGTEWICIGNTNSVYGAYQLNIEQTISSDVVTVINFENPLYSFTDTSYNITTKQLTPPTGLYNIILKIKIGILGVVIPSELLGYISINNNIFVVSEYLAGLGYTAECNINITIPIQNGDIITFTTSQNSGSNRIISASSYFCYSRIGDI